MPAAIRKVTPDLRADRRRYGVVFMEIELLWRSAADAAGGLPGGRPSRASE
jgi:hypothetical protein